jgi:hypothetical protein
VSRRSLLFAAAAATGAVSLGARPHPGSTPRLGRWPLDQLSRKWLGDPVFFPIMEEFNRRKVLVATHPTAANCCANLQPNVPFLIERFVRNPLLVPSSAPLFPEGVAAELRRFYYGTAQVAHPAAMSALAQVVATSQIVLGTDFPYRTAADQLKGLRDCGVFKEAELRKIERDTALAFLPRSRT